MTACNGTIVNDTEMGEVIQLQGDQRKDVQEFLTDKKEGLELDAKTIKVRLNKSPNRSFHNNPIRSMASNPDITSRANPVSYGDLLWKSVKPILPLGFSSPVLDTWIGQS